MSTRNILFALCVVPLVACKGGAIDLDGENNGGGEEEWSGGEEDARLIANMVTWTCNGGDKGSYEGAYSLEVSLEYAPDGLAPMELPAAGECDSDLSMFPLDAGSEGADLDGVESPVWVMNAGTSTESSGDMARMAPGFFIADILGNQHSCQEMGEMIADGIVIDDAGPLTGVVSPESGALFSVDTLDAATGAEIEGALEFGDEVLIEWDQEDFDTVWIQLRMETNGVAYDYTTCNATGQENFTIDDAIWNDLDSELPVEMINLYVGFENSEVQETSTGIKADVLTRAIHVEVLED